MICFDADVLFEYIMLTKDLRDPLTREPLVLHERLRLQRICGRVLTDTLPRSSFVRWWLSIQDSEDTSPIRESDDDWNI